MREYTIIRDEIKSLGASLLEERLHPEMFGSAYCIFEGHAGTRFRLVWDGKEGYGFLQSLDPSGIWHDAGSHVSGVSNPQAAKFAALLSIAKTLVHGNAAA